jgi:hypothetical protein
VSEHNPFSDIEASFDLLMGSKNDVLDTPVTKRISFRGDECEARGSARFLSDEVSDEGYSVEHELVDVSDGRHWFEFRVTEGE